MARPQFERKFWILTVELIIEIIFCNISLRNIYRRSGMMRNHYKMVGGKGWTCAQIQGDVYGCVAVGKIVIVLPAVHRGFVFRYQSVLHKTAANSAERKGRQQLNPMN